MAAGPCGSVRSMFIHTVFFYLKPEVTPAQRDQLVRDCRELLGAIPTVRKLHAGTPAPTPDGPRPVVDTTYGVGLTVLFDDAPGHDTYQPHPLHAQFIDRNKHLWAKVQVYDFVE